MPRHGFGRLRQLQQLAHRLQAEPSKRGRQVDPLQHLPDAHLRLVRVRLRADDADHGRAHQRPVIGLREAGGRHQVRDREAAQSGQQPRGAEDAGADQLAQLVAVFGVRQQDRVGPHHQGIDLGAAVITGDPVHAQAGLGAGVAEGREMFGLHGRAVIDPVMGMAMGQHLEPRIGRRPRQAARPLEAHADDRRLVVDAREVVRGGAVAEVRRGDQQVLERTAKADEHLALIGVGDALPARDVEVHLHGVAARPRTSTAGCSASRAPAARTEPESPVSPSGCPRSGNRRRAGPRGLAVAE